MKISKPLQILMLSTIALGLQPSGHAQGNLVNLNNWTASSAILPGFSPVPPPKITSFNSAYFLGWLTSYTNNPTIFALSAGILTGNLNTTPGATYEISFSLDMGDSVGIDVAFMSFGNITAGGKIPVLLNTNVTSENPNITLPVCCDYTVLATSDITTMSFSVTPDVSCGVNLENLLVVETPEVSTVRLFGFGGCALLIAQQWRRLFPKRKRN